LSSDPLAGPSTNIPPAFFNGAGAVSNLGVQRGDLQGRQGSKAQDPLKKHKNEVKHTLEEWKDRYKDKSWKEITTEAGWKQGQPLGPNSEWRYILNPIDGNVMDMRHVVVVGYGYGENIGNLIEHIQFALGQTGSAYDPQDYYSNKVGAYFSQLRSLGSWSSSSWAYDFKRFIDTQYSTLFKTYKP